MQVPTLLLQPPEDANALDEALGVCDLAGLVLDPWQVTALGSMLGESGGRWAATECGLIVPRQNGKGGVLEARALYELFVVAADRPNHLIIWTAHEFKTAQEAFLRMRALIQSSPVLMAAVAKVRTANGEEGFELHNGARLRFLARSKGSGRGFSADLLILDEAFQLPPAVIRATLSTLSARPDPQIIYTTTPPEKADEAARHIIGARKRAHDGASGLAWCEWAAERPEVENVDELRAWASDPEVWRRHNPAMGIRLTEEFTRTEFDAMVAANDLEGFIRERLGEWPPEEVSEADRVISVAAFDRAVERGSAPGVAHDGPIVLGLDRSPTTGETAIVAVGGCGAGLLVEVVDCRGGVGWLVGRVADLVARHDIQCVTWDERGPLRDVSDELTEAVGDRARMLATADVVEASMRLVRAFDEDRIVVAPSAWMSDAVANATARKVGDAWAVERRGPVSVASVVAAGFGLLIVETEPYGAALDQILV